MFTWGPQSGRNEALRLLMNLDGNALEEVTGQTFGTTGTVGYDSGKFGQCLLLDGTAVSATDGLALPLYSTDTWDITSRTNWTIHGWFRCDTYQWSGGSRLLEIREDPSVSNTNVSLSVSSPFNSTTTLQFNCSIPYGINTVVSLRKQFPYDNDWHHFAVTKSGSNLRVSIDGSASANNDGMGSGGTDWSSTFSYLRPSGPRQVRVGNSFVTGAGSAFKGGIDALCISDGVLFNLQTGFSVPTSPPLL